LGLFGQFAREFRARYPKPASDLHLSGETYEDPSVARLIQSVALMSARVRKRLDDDYPKFTESLLESLYPHYLRPMPSHTIVQVGGRTGEAGAWLPDAPVLLPRGTMLRTSARDDSVCLFRTVYDVLLAPLRVAQVSFAPLLKAPRALRLPRGAASSIGITIETPGPRSLPDVLPARLRLFVDGEASTRAALIDALFLRGACAFVQAGGEDAWLPLASVPLALAGLTDADAMIPFPARSHPALRLLSEYFCYPEKFNFIDIDTAQLSALLPPRCASFTLHVVLRGLAADSDPARLLAGVGARNLLPACTPVINLFPKAGAPLQLSYTSADHPLLADGAHASAYEIHSVDAVRLVREGPCAGTGGAGPGGGRGGVTHFAPLYSANGAAGSAEPQGDGKHYWITRRDHAVAAVSPGHEMRIALIDADFRTTQTTGTTLSTMLTCTNRDLPTQLRYGDPRGDLRTDELSGVAPIRMLRKPSPSWRFATGRGAHWRLISHLSLNHASLSMAGLADFQKMLALYDLPRSPGTQRLIAGIRGLEHGAVRAWVKSAPIATLMPGIGIRLLVDEEAFAGSSLYVFARVLDHYFALNGQLNCFTRLQVVSSLTGQEILACEPRHSSQPLA
jgi:type VI secretion system protein ImpG